MLILRRLALFISLAVTLAAQSNFYLKDGDTVVFYGDSITDQRMYTTFIEAFVLTRFPGLHVRFVHSGWGGDRVSGGGGGSIDVRLKRDVIAYQPTVMTIMLGMNDGRYEPFDATTYQNFTSGYENIIKTMKKAIPNIRITLIQPSPYDDVTRPPKFEGGYNGVLARYGEHVRELAQREKLNVADMNTGVVATLRAVDQKDHELAQRIIPDRVHPSPTGHMLMAESLLKSWNAPALVAAVEIDAAAGVVTRSENTAVAELVAKEGLVWTQTDKALPMPINWTEAAMDLAIHSSDFMTAIDDEPLTVKGLPAGSYTLRIDDDLVGTFTAAQLEGGINLAELTTPMSKQATEVLMLTYYHNNLHFVSDRMITFPLTKYGFETARPARDTLEMLENDVIAARRAVAQPVQHRFEVRGAP